MTEPEGAILKSVRMNGPVQIPHDRTFKSTNKVEMEVFFTFWDSPLRIIRSTRYYWLAYIYGHSMMAVAGRT
jgi:hypothetical protein